MARACGSTRAAWARSTAPCERAPRGSMPSATSFTGRRWLTSPRTKGSSPSRTRPGSARTRLIKIVGERKYGELLGAHTVGSKATELIQELVNVRVLEGGYPEVARIVHAHPTLSEGVMEAARAADGWLIHG